MTNGEVLKIFEASGGLLSGHFLLTSGRHSDRYMQCAKLFVDPEHAEQLCAALAQKLKGVDIGMIASPAIGGIVMGYALARQLGVKNIFAERNAEGRMEFRRGFSVKPNERVLVVEDVVTTGGSVREVLDLVRASGGAATGAACIVDRSAGRVDLGCPLYSLLSMEIPSWEATACPICKAGGPPLVKPGSRK
ncbi:MAG: orotate phosphoribosyltransferase [Clostridiales bacterium]|nr:orotate phosphoribosyltransferase [Clostridiales bacterium]